MSWRVVTFDYGGGGRRVRIPTAYLSVTVVSERLAEVDAYATRRSRWGRMLRAGCGAGLRVLPRDRSTFHTDAPLTRRPTHAVDGAPGAYSLSAEGT